MKKVVMSLQVTVVVPQGERGGAFECADEHDGMIVAQFVFDQHEDYAEFVTQHESVALVH